MNQQTNSVIDNNDFMTLYKGKFHGVLRWPQLDELWDKVRQNSDSGWYVYAVGETIPTKLTNSDEITGFIEEIDRLLRREHDEDYCGIVYADDLKQPQFIKIFDPNNIGTSCSVGTKAPLPGWILSKVPPVDLPEAMRPTANRRRWWQSLFK